MGRTWVWIVNHYYNANAGAEGLSSGQRTAYMTSPLEIVGASASPNSVSPGQAFEIAISANNHAGLSHTQVIIGASIYASGVGYVDDPANDKKVTLSPGMNSLSRPFVVPPATPNGLYDLVVALWLDVDENGAINTNVDLALHSKVFSQAITVGPSFNYSLTNSGPITVTAGRSGSTTITATLTSGTTQAVTLSAAGLPTGASASFSPTACNPPCTSTLTISTSATTPAGTYQITVTGSPLGRTTMFNLVVTAPSQSLAVALTATPASGTAPLSTTLSANVSGTATGTVNYTFWWNCTDPGTSVSAVSAICGDPHNATYGAKFDGITENPKSVSHTYTAAGTYTAKVIAERGTVAPPESRTTVTVTAPMQFFTLTVAKAGTGSGTVTSNPTGITCGTDCTESYPYNTSVTLTATPSAGSTFSGWSGDADCTDGVVTMTGDKTCTATFTAATPGIVTLATGLSNPNAITTDDTYVYWADYGSGTVKKVSKNGGTVTTLASGLYSPSGVAVDGSYVYIGEDYGINAARVHKVPKAGGSVITLASGLPSVWGITIDSSYVYFADGYGGTIQRVPKGGGSVSILATGSQSPAGIAVDSSAVYWTEFVNPGTVRKVPWAEGR